MKFLSLLLVVICMQVSAKTNEIADVGVVFADSGTFEAALVRFGPPADNTFLVQLKGVDDPLNGKVIKVKTEGGGTGAQYYVKDGGGNLLRAPAHDYFGWEAYVGGKTYKINQDKKKSADLKTADMLSTYLKQNKK